MNFDQPEQVMREVKAAVEYRNKHLASFDDQIQRYRGPYYTRDGMANATDYAPENTYYEYMSLMIPKLIFDNPRVNCQSRKPGPANDVAQAMRYGLNRWVRDCVLRKKLVELATDMLFTFGVAVVREDYRDSGDRAVMLPDKDEQRPSKPMWPVVERISQHRFIVDPGCQRFDDAKFMGHEICRTRGDLLQEAKDFPEAGWDVDAIKNAPSSDVYRSRTQNKVVPDRDEIVFYELWVPSLELPESPGPDAGFHGTILTVGATRTSEGATPTGKFWRKARPYYGPRTGPYSMFGVYKVPNCVIPLSPLLAVEAQIGDLNQHVRAASNSMLKHKRIVGVNDPRTAQLVKDTGHDYVAVVPFEDGRAQVQEFELGGQTEQQRLWIATCRERADRALGMDEALRGAVSGAGTATEHTIASEAANTRIAYIKQAFTDSVTALLEKVAFYMYHDDRIVFPLGSEVARQLGMPPDQTIYFEGGGHDTAEGYHFEDLELEIEPYSMERSSEGLAQKRALEVHTLILNTLPVMQQYPDYPWQDHFQKIGNAMNAPDLPELVDQQLLERFSQDLAQMQGIQAQARLASAIPMLQAQAGLPRKPVETNQPTKDLPMAGQMMQQMLQAQQQQAPTGAPAQR
ncbi:hypothetical protein [Limnobacter sp.]|uniref:hypothetical protein n=1 Tax=Limnobacter sp. TaxID=2003368 RepID=UPI0025BC4AD8|nr:hypothetical protein [Limnobacter sp.]